MAAFPYLYRSHRDTISALRSLVPDVATVDRALEDVSDRKVLLAALVGMVFGIVQFAEVLFGNTYQASPIPDYPLIVGILVQADRARQLGADYLYLGFWVPDSPKMSYKARFRPLELRIGEQWTISGPEDALPVPR